MKLEHYINTIIYSDNRSDLRLFKQILRLFSLAYKGGSDIRRRLFRTGVRKTAHLPCAVISVGNITAGGAGKTPMTIYLADRLKRMGYDTAVVSRGYGGQAEKRGGIVSDGISVLMDAKTSGDEPNMIARRLEGVPVVVGADRHAAGMLAVREFDPRVIILDDAFQHIRLNRDIDLLLLDYQKPFGNTYLLPRGPLRESPAALLRADAIIFTRFDPGTEQTEHLPENLIRHCKVFKSRHAPVITRWIPKNAPLSVKSPPDTGLPELSLISGKRVFLFSGIADNSRFKETVEQLKARIAGTCFFPDHHAYSARDIKEIHLRANELSPDFLITTEKDYSRISDGVTWPADLFVLDVEIAFSESEEHEFLQFIAHRLLKLRVSRC